MNAVLFDVALTAYILAAAAALASLVWRRDDLSRVARLLTQVGWVCHTRPACSGASSSGGRRC